MGEPTSLSQATEASFEPCGRCIGLGREGHDFLRQVSPRQPVVVYGLLSGGFCASHIACLIVFERRDFFALSAF